MNITVNDKPMHIDIADATLKGLALKLNLPENGTAMSLNGAFKHRDQWGLTRLHDDDKVMVFSAAFGG